MDDENNGLKETQQTKVMKPKIFEKSSSKFKLLAEKATYGINVDITHQDNMSELEKAIHSESEKFDIKTERAFSWLQVCTASLDIFAHGSNDVANAVAPFAAMVSIYETGEARDEVPVYIWILVIGAFGMVLG